MKKIKTFLFYVILLKYIKLHMNGNGHDMKKETQIITSLGEDSETRYLYSYCLVYKMTHLL